MGLPYKLTTPRSTVATPTEAPAKMPPQKVLRASAESGKEIGDVIREVAAPDREVGGPSKLIDGNAVYPEGVPWPAVGAKESVGKLPFKNMK